MSIVTAIMLIMTAVMSVVTAIMSITIIDRTGTARLNVLSKEANIGYLLYTSKRLTHLQQPHLLLHVHSHAF